MLLSNYVEISLFLPFELNTFLHAKFSSCKNKSPERLPSMQNFCREALSTMCHSQCRYYLPGAARGEFILPDFRSIPLVGRGMPTMRSALRSTMGGEAGQEVSRGKVSGCKKGQSREKDPEIRESDTAFF